MNNPLNSRTGTIKKTRRDQCFDDIGCPHFEKEYFCARHIVVNWVGKQMIFHAPGAIPDIVPSTCAKIIVLTLVGKIERKGSNWYRLPPVPDKGGKGKFTAVLGCPLPVRKVLVCRGVVLFPPALGDHKGSPLYAAKT
jgi:hypothetical protein